MNIMCTVDMLGVDNAKQYLKKHGNPKDEATFNKFFGGDFHYSSGIDPDVRIGTYWAEGSYSEDEAQTIGDFIQRACGFAVLEVKITNSRIEIEIDPDGYVPTGCNFPIVAA